ncbi:hypothetical protein [Sulfitobacter sp. SK011]|uniref:hypothetical protein n=1 Tax=Sulfitobacter sp. SK011 TaxID=1389004 RepID=UPI000E0C3DCA|nr:hypothetical protein [Sulfitobacter sp. SK011]AXI42270.1 hypothetical protein C1J02_10220 [Sulfitobacter sp. SK011]
MIKGDAHDPKGLIFESYRIDGISKSECRTIFLDWALSLPIENDTGKTISHLLTQYGPDNPDHPMTEVLNEGLVSMAAPRRRGGWRSRTRN